MLGRGLGPASHARRKTDLTTENQRARKYLFYMVRREGVEPPSALRAHSSPIGASPSGSKPATGSNENRGLGDSETE